LNKQLLRAIQYVFFLGLGLALLYWAYKDVDVNDITNSLAHAKWGWVITSFGLGYVAMIIRGARWNILLEPMGYKVNTWSAIHSVAFGYCMNNIVPRSGELARCGLLNRSEKVPVDKLFGTVILERIVDLLLLGCFVILVFFTHSTEIRELLNNISNINNSSPQEESNFGLYLGIFAVVGLIGAFVIFKYFGHLTIVQKILNFTKGMGQGLKSIFKLRRKGLFLLLSLGIWGTWILMSQCMMFALEETQELGFLDSIFFMVAASFGMLVPTPGGLGSYHITAKLGLEALGRSAAVGVTYGTITWAGKTVLELVMGAIGFIVVTRRGKKTKK
jgi:uncharacterized membrane protein YbhN (UPF0104 family)